MTPVDLTTLRAPDEAAAEERAWPAVREAFAANFEDGGAAELPDPRPEPGEVVVDLMGGFADRRREVAFGPDTLTPLFSTTKAVAALLVARLVDEGRLAYDQPVADVWPEFAQAGKQDVTIAMVLGHRSGVIGPRRRLHWSDAADWDTVCAHIAAAEPWWEPGTAQGYHMVTFGFILGEVVRRVSGRTIGDYLRTEIAEPLGIDVHIGLPVSEHHRSAEMVNKPHIRDVLADGGAPRHPESLAEHPMAGMAVAMGFVPDDELGSNAIERWRELEFPATNAHVTALGMATFYNALAQEKLLSREHMELVRVSQGGFDTDIVLGPRVADHGWGLGYMLNQRGAAGPNHRTFGHGGSGGSFAFVDLEHRIGYAYVMNRFDATKCNADPRSAALSNAVYSALGVIGD